MKNDNLNRNIEWAFYKGSSNKTVVLMHHYDTVSTDDFGIYKEYAYDPKKVEELFKSNVFELSKSVKNDLESKEWIFGRGASDMKSGGAIQLSLFDEYSKNSFDGNILLLCLPDEENFSAGMRSAIYLLNEMKAKYSLEYVLMINSEPHERVEENKFTIYDGSAGKIMPIFLARGKMAHVGQVFTGINPISILSQIQIDTELNETLIEKDLNTAVPPGTWLYLKDRKYEYNVSLPATAGGYMSILNLTKSPNEIMEQLKEITVESTKKFTEQLEKKYSKFRSVSSVDYGDIDYSIKVMFFEELLNEFLSENPKKESLINDYKKQLVKRLNKMELDAAEAGFLLIEKVLELRNKNDAVVVIAIAPPFYPCVSNSTLSNYKKLDELILSLNEHSKSRHNLEVTTQNYFTGICDLSYAMYNFEDVEYVEKNVILWNDYYEIPLNLIRELSMPVLNIGPWGKDLHQYSERVKKNDVLKVVPDLIDFTIKKAFEIL